MNKKLLTKTTAIFAGLVIITNTLFAQSMSTPAKRAILIDATTNSILFEKDADTPFPPASMSKLMTVYMAFDAIKNGELQLDDEVVVSDSAWRDWNNRGSTMFLRARDTVTVADLLRGIIVLSGNDACVVLAEHMAGSHGVFVDWMNAKATQLGMDGSNFENANGWPAEGHVMTARDLATLSYKLVTDFPDLYPMFAETEFLYKDFRSNRFNRNPLLGRFAGADGLKTGHTEESGYGLAASAERDGRRLVLVVGGLTSVNERMRESQRLMQFGFRNFSHYPLFGAGDTVDTAEVWLGDQPSLKMVLAEDMALTMSRRQRAEMKVSVKYTNPIAAPIKKDQQVGTLIIELPNRSPITAPLLAASDVGEISGFGKITAALEHLLFGTAGRVPTAQE
ncbi:D-alanyl-D-alanine carboxypeptidase family protein [Kordiimonas sp. SCSIO 12610]|uniref:D-alanyl-D-alanine carboxypeptidase family protein n=1 Tax=Kordiimonas sp. SCSIO 12610 TaxID=2829597 RepID=UPI0021088A6B|nr:D-alanyl-D-alanine carboxypeptidase family protein [Kordiimonas sp. SCSIO 12610]UTW53936.1 D-alanyl-D-alanine carboxypeptidase [Kordiimonas sp. SCSIO 12610]